MNNSTLKPATFTGGSIFQAPSFTPRSANTSSSKVDAQTAVAVRGNETHAPSLPLDPPSPKGNPFLEMGSNAPSVSGLAERQVLTTQVAARMALLPPSLREMVQNYLDRLKKDGDVIARVWLRAFVSVPAGSVPPASIDREAARAHVDVRLLGQEDAKDAVIDELVFWQLTGIDRFKLCLQGPPGVGKTRLLKSLGEIFKRPVVTLNVDSLGDDTSLIGHAPSYQGNNLGAFLNALIQAGCDNPIIFIDELDKVRDDPAGRRILDLLNQWLDDERPYFDSAYLGMRIDLSKCAFVVAVNDLSRLARYTSLVDRLQPLIEMAGYDTATQREIFCKNILPELNGGLPQTVRVTFDDKAVDALIEGYGTYKGHQDTGVRSLKEWANFTLKRVVARGRREVLEADVQAALKVLLPKQKA